MTSVRPELERPSTFEPVAEVPIASQAAPSPQDRVEAAEAPYPGQYLPLAAPTRSRQRFKDYALKHALDYNRGFKDMGNMPWRGRLYEFCFPSVVFCWFRHVEFQPVADFWGAWWYNSDGFDSWSHSWAVADKFYDFTGNLGRAKLVPYYGDLTWGDVVQMNHNPSHDATWDHTLAVTGKYLGKIYVSSHDRDYANKRMSDVLADNPSARYARWHFTYGS